MGMAALPEAGDRSRVLVLANVPGKGRDGGESLVAARRSMFIWRKR